MLHAWAACSLSRYLLMFHGTSLSAGRNRAMIGLKAVLKGAKSTPVAVRRDFYRRICITPRSCSLDLTSPYGIVITMGREAVKVYPIPVLRPPTYSNPILRFNVKCCVSSPTCGPISMTVHIVLCFKAWRTNHFGEI